MLSRTAQKGTLSGKGRPQATPSSITYTTTVYTNECGAGDQQARLPRPEFGWGHRTKSQTRPQVGPAHAQRARGAKIILKVQLHGLGAVGGQGRHGQGPKQGAHTSGTTG